MNKFFIVFLFFVALISCSVNNTKEDNSLEKYFTENNLTGTFAFFNNGTGEFSIYNMGRYRDSAYLPFSSYNVVTSLIGLETGRIKDSAELIRTNFDSLTIGQDTVKHWLDTLGYNPQRVTADEQLGLVKKLYFGQLPFQPRTQRIVKNALKKEDNSNYILSYETGSGVVKNTEQGWLAGWIEENKHPYFFVLHTESRDTTVNLVTAQEQILKGILKQYDFLEGKR
ncbi:MAG: class D beta-lactamase [Chitinophagaceae bacterium]|nr:class D beta-lactamase [Chitinophagaceae bacterium]